MIRRALSVAAFVAILCGTSAASLSVTLRSGALGGVLEIDLQGDPHEVYVILLSDDPANMAKWSGITLSTPGFIGSLSASGTATAVLPLPGAAVLDQFTIYAQAVTVMTGPPITVDDVSSICAVTLSLKNHFVPSLGSLAAGRGQGTATALADGRMLVAGGGGGAPFQPTSLDAAEVYDPCADAFSPVGNSMSVQRAMHAATLLTDGSMFISGGADAAQNVTATCDLYDPATNTFSPTAPMSRGRIGHTATLLPNGFVLVAGGSNVLAPDFLSFLFGNTITTEIYDPATQTFAAGPAIASGAKAFHTATTLDNGRVVLAGGYSITYVSGFAVAIISSNIDVFDPSTGTFLINPFRSMRRTRVAHSAALLADGRVLFAGGASDPIESSPVIADAEIYDPVADVSTLVAPMATARGQFVMSLLGSGKVLAAGGFTGDFLTVGTTALGELYDPALDQWTPVADTLAVGRGAAKGGSLPSGRVIVVGGSDGSSVGYTSADLYVE